MDRNTIIAVVLSVIVITVGMTIQTAFFAPEPVTTQTVETVTPTTGEATTASTNALPTQSVGSITAIGKEGDNASFVVENKVMQITFDPKGASVSSIKLKQHLDNGSPVEVLFRDEESPNAFLLYAGDNHANPITDVFNYTIEDLGSITRVSFTRDYEMASTKQKFSITKQYAVSKNSEYLFQIAVGLKTPDGSTVPLNINDYVYSLGVEPQVGPSFKVLSGNYDYRHLYYKDSDKKGKTLMKLNKGQFSTTNSFDWAAVASKYFAIMAIPVSADVPYKLVATEQTGLEGVPQEDRILVSRPVTGSSDFTDIYSIYCGPQITSALNSYDIAKDNVFGLTDLHLNKILDSSSWLGWLEIILKVILGLFYRIIPNYGVAIILLTILIKLILQPISKKGMDSTAKMSALMQELQTRYKDDPEALNQAMAKLYKNEGINPMGSCLPMLIQFPIFIALYGLLNKHFELRGAMFIPGWIPDLSIPDTVFTLSFNLPFLGPEIHILPILYTASMIFSMKITQGTSTQAAGQQAGMMKFMTYGMPLIFFFVLYNAPSGLLLYWSVMNFISIIQQVMVNKKKKGQFEKEIEAENAAKQTQFPRKKKK